MAPPDTIHIAAFDVTVTLDPEASRGLYHRWFGDLPCGLRLGIVRDWAPGTMTIHQWHAHIYGGYVQPYGLGNTPDEAAEALRKAIPEALREAHLLAQLARLLAPKEAA
jgi:hypothetical protein